MRTLTNYNRADIAYKLASNKTYPSWGYMAEQGATTIWELWNGNTANPQMNSQNHVMLLGDLLIWLNENVAGIKSDDTATAFKKIIMKPATNTGLAFVNASYQSLYGTIKSNWKQTDSTFEWKISIPANTSAIVYLPVYSQNKNYVNGKLFDNKMEGLKFSDVYIQEKIGAFFRLEVANGDYEFVTKNKI